MNKKFKILMAAAMTVMTLAACSTPAPSTTAAAGTTAAGTSDATTAGVTQPVTTPATLPVTTPATTSPSTTATATMPPATTTAVKPVNHTSDVANVYIKSAEAMTKLNSFRITSTTQSEIMGMTIDTKSVIDMFVKEKKSKISTTVMGQTSDMYLMDKKMYMNNPTDGSWMYIPADDLDEPGMETVEQAKLVTDKEYMDMFSFEKTADGYKIKTKKPLSLADFAKLGNNPNTTGVADPLDPVDETLDMTYELEMSFNKDYYMTENIMTMNTVIDKETMVNHMTMTYSDFNKVPAIKLPAEALNAKEFTIPEMPSTKP